MRGFWRKTAIVGLMTVLVGLLVHLSRADPPLDPSIPEQQAKALRAASYYTEGGHHLTDLLIKKGVGFEHDTHAGIDRQKWRSLPSVYMLETMYLSAEAASPGGGDRALQLLAIALSQRYKAAEDDPALKELVRLGRENAGKPVEFKGISRKPGEFPKLDAKQKAAIDALAHYCEGGAGAFSARSVLIDRMGLEPTDANEILRQPLTDAEVLYEGIKRVKIELRDAVLSDIVRHVDNNFLNAQKEKDFDPYRKRSGPLDPPTWSGGPDSPRPWRPGDGPTPGGGGRGSGGGGSGGRGGGVGGGPAPTGNRPGGPTVDPIKPDQLRDLWQANRADDYKRFQNRVYSPPSGAVKSTPVRPKFGGVIRGGRGFGGVVLGNDVSDNGLPKPKAIAWEVDTKVNEKGALVVSFVDGTTAKLRDVGLVDAYAAHAIYFRTLGKGENVVDPAEPKDAIGLVGIQRGGEYFDCGPERIVNRGIYWSVVMHPAIADSDLGWSVLRCDVLPFPQLRGPVVQTVRTKTGKNEAEKLEKMWTNQNIYTWKFSDVPLAVSVSDGGLVVVRKDDPNGPKFEEGVRRSALITMNAYREKEMDTKHDDDAIPEYADQFYPLVPALCSASPDYRRLNEFARVCAVVRWVKENGGEFPKDSEPPAPTPLPGAAGVVVTDAGDLIPAPAVDRKELAAGLRQKVLLRLALLELQRPVLEIAVKQSDNMEVIIDRVAAEVLKAPDDKPEFRTARTKLKEAVERNKLSAPYQRLKDLKNRILIEGLLAETRDEAVEIVKRLEPEVKKAQEEWRANLTMLNEAYPGSEYWLNLRVEFLKSPSPRDTR